MGVAHTSLLCLDKSVTQSVKGSCDGHILVDTRFDGPCNRRVPCDCRGSRVTVIDNLLFGGEALMTFLSHPNFHFSKADITDIRCLRDSLPRNWPKPDVIFHLAGIVGFPACQAVGKQAAWHYNVAATRNILEQADSLRVGRFVYTSTYSAYGTAPVGGLVTEESPLNPQSFPSLQHFLKYDPHSKLGCH